MLSKEKIAAIYDLRDAVEAKVRAEHELEREPSAGARAALLDATLEMEAKTQDAIEVCHTCGHVHKRDEDHVSQRGDNVIDVDFGRHGDAQAPGEPT
jgi:hypothetical protein